MLVWLQLSMSAASAWTVDELVAAPPVSEADVVRVGTFDGAPAVVLLGPSGLQVTGLTGEVLVQDEGLTGNDLLVRNLDDRGSDELLLCGPEGLRLVRADRDGIYGTVSLTTQPCEAVAAYDAGSYDGLLTAGGGVLTRWVPTVTSLRPTEVASLPPGPVRLVSLGVQAAVAAQGSLLLRVSSHDVVEEDVGGPILGLAAAGSEPALVVGGEAPELRIGEERWALPATGASLVSGEGEGAPAVWILDATGSAVGVPTAGAIAWTPVPVTPVRATAIDQDEDHCVDLAISDLQGNGARLLGSCAADLPVPVRPVAPVASLDWPPRVPEPPSEHVIRELWGTLDVQVGQSLDVQLVDEEGRATLWRSRGGPPGLRVARDGRLEWAPEADEVGQWRVSVKLSEGLAGRWNGLLLRVFPARDDAAAPAATVHPVPSAASDRARVRVPLLAPHRCAVGLGFAGGAATAGEVTWQNLGGPDVRGGVSPMASMTCAGGSEGPVQWIVGVDTAPFFSYAAVPEDRTHALAFMGGIQVGSERIHGGPYATAGFDVMGVGARAEWLGLRDWRDHPMGIEARLLWLAPQVGAEGTLAWVWSL